MPITINAKTSKKSFKIDSIVPGDICEADAKLKLKKKLIKQVFSPFCSLLSNHSIAKIPNSTI